MHLTRDFFMYFFVSFPDFSFCFDHIPGIFHGNPDEINKHRFKLNFG